MLLTLCLMVEDVDSSQSLSVAEKYVILIINMPSITAE